MEKSWVLAPDNATVRPTILVFLLRSWRKEVMAELEETNGSLEQENTGNPFPSSVASLALVFQNPEFVSMMSKALLPSIVDGVKHSLTSPPHSESHGSTLSQAERFTSISSGPPKGHSVPSTTSGSKKGLISPSIAAGSSSGISTEPPAKIARITIDDTNNGPAVTDSNDQHEYEPPDDDDILESSSQRWFGKPRKTLSRWIFPSC